MSFVDSLNHEQLNLLELPSDNDVQDLVLFDYQKLGIQNGRKEFAKGKRRVVYSAPTGAGKTVIAIYLLKVLYENNMRAIFVCDRIELVKQTSQQLKKYGIPHGILQADNTKGINAKILVCSVQTLTSNSRREFASQLIDRADLIVIDECHTISEKMIALLDEHDKGKSKKDVCRVIGLTATPFTKGMGNIYDSVVNIAKTNDLIDKGFIVEPVVYVGTEINMKGAKQNGGEWVAGEVEARGTKIVGDVLNEWVKWTNHHFGGPVKTLVFSATTAHGEEIVRVFQEAGYNFRQVSYNTPPETRKQLIDEFRKPDSEIVGLVSVDMLAKGFDVPDVMCMIGCRPYRRSFAAHIQQIGRVLRSHPGKQFGLILDHAGNFHGFAEPTAKFFKHGVDSLYTGLATKKIIRKEDKDRRDIVCKACGFVMQVGDASCAMCGAERPRKRSVISQHSGKMKEINLRDVLDGNKDAPGRAPDVSRSWAKHKPWVWSNICRWAYAKKPIHEQARKLAYAQFRQMFKVSPPHWFEFEGDGEPAHEEVALVCDLQYRDYGRAYSKRKQREKKQLANAS